MAHIFLANFNDNCVKISCLTPGKPAEFRLVPIKIMLENPCTNPIDTSSEMCRKSINAQKKDKQNTQKHIEL